MSSLCSDSDNTKPGLPPHPCCRVPSKGRSFLGLALGFQSHQLQFGWFWWLCLCFWVRTWNWAPRRWAGLEPHCLELFPWVVDLTWRKLVGETKAELGTERYCWGPGPLLLPSPRKRSERTRRAQLRPSLVWGEPGFLAEDWEFTRQQWDEEEQGIATLAWSWGLVPWCLALVPSSLILDSNTSAF